MYLLDTEVVGRLRGRGNDPADERLFEWVGTQMPTTLFVSAITMVELESGARLLERKDKPAAAALRNWIENRLRPAFDGRIIGIDDPVIRKWAELGFADFRDGILAATALHHGLIFATREVRNFRTTKVKTIDPWAYSPQAEDLDWRRASRSAPVWLKGLFVRA